MRWYVNDASLQAQFSDETAFIDVLTDILKLRSRQTRLRDNLYVTRMVGEAIAVSDRKVREVVMRAADKDVRRQILTWVTALGPFLEDDRRSEADDYFECLGADVTHGGAGEAARRRKADESVGLYSFAGGALDFCVDPLPVDHGLIGDRLGRYDVPNVWTTDALVGALQGSEPDVASWRLLVVVARERYPLLWLPDSLFENAALAAEPFERKIATRTLQLLRHLNDYMSSRSPDGAPTAASNELVRDLFTNAGDSKTPFTAESASNKQAFKKEMSFTDPEDTERRIFAHWHGKISHRYFRMHFEWPVPANASKLKVLYLGPKITKS